MEVVLQLQLARLPTNWN